MNCKTCGLPIYQRGVSYTGPACSWSGAHPYGHASKPAVELQHEHRHHIPVEWEYKGIADEPWGHGHRDFPPSMKRVTKLRCVCGDEVDR